MSRARFAAATLALITTGAAALFVTLAPAQAAPDPTVAALPVAEAATPVSTSDGSRTLIVDPTTDLAATNATIKVQGKGFDTDHGLYIAVCADGSGAPKDLTTCVGGAVPDSNNTTAWAHIGGDQQGSGGVKAAWGPDGSFDISLALPLVTEGEVNCVTRKCSLYTASDDDSIRTEDNAVALTFKAPPSSSSSAAPTAPGTAIPQQIGSPSIVAGGTQLVIFSGFRAGEQVNLTLFSDPITLSPVDADSTGVARVEFIVPADFPAGTHRLEAIGQDSGTLGVASFQVTAPVVSSTPSPSPSPSPTPSPSSSPVTSSSAITSWPPASSAVTSSSAAAAPDGDSGGGLWWLWLILGIVVVAGIITGIVVYRRNQQQQRELAEQEIAAAAAGQAAAGGAAGQAPGGTDQYGSDAPTVFLPPVPPAGGPPPGADPYGLLSGRDHPDNPSLYSGQGPAGPTQVLGPQGQQGPAPYGRPLGYGGHQQGYNPPPEYAGAPPAGPGGLAGPPTEAIPPTRPEPTGPPSAPRGPGGSGGTDGPGTQAWAPDFDDTGTGGQDSGAGTDTGGSDDSGGDGGGSSD